MTGFNKLYNLILESIITEGIAEVQQVLLKYKSKPIVNKLITQLKEIPPQKNRNKKANLIAHFISKGDKISNLDNEKVQKAFTIVDKFNVDLNKYNKIDQLLNAYQSTLYMDFVKKNYSDPDKIPEFTDKQEYQNGVVVYQVENTLKGQKAVRYVIDANWGYDANPWCLAARQNGTLKKAQNYWWKYNSYKKRIAFQNGQLLAFSACDHGKYNLWWDRNDKSSMYLTDKDGNPIETKESIPADIFDTYRLTLNKETGRYDVSTDIIIDQYNVNKWINEKGQIKYPLGRIKGCFWLKDARKLTSLKNLPLIVNKRCEVYMWSGEDLTSLGNALQKVGGDCSFINCMNLKNLKGCPQNVEGRLAFYDCNNLQTLEGAPEETNAFLVSSTSLTSLKGCPKKVKYIFSCDRCTNLKSLQGGPDEVENVYSCVNCHSLTSLKGGPKYVGGPFWCSNCQNLTSLQGGPERVGQDYICNNNLNLLNFKGIAKEIGRDLMIYVNDHPDVVNKRDYSQLKKIKVKHIKKFKR